MHLTHTTKHILTLTDVDMYLSYCHARLALLLIISQTRFGAAAVLNAGLFHSVKASTLFTIDPDLGVGMYTLQSSTYFH